MILVQPSIQCCKAGIQHSDESVFTFLKCLLIVVRNLSVSSISKTLSMSLAVF